MKNIVFIGLPGSGKTTISQILAKSLSRQWFDSDFEIEKAEKMTISEIFDQKGEEWFRAKETECIAKLMAEQGAVISLGGGAVVRNAELLKTNSIVLYLSRDIENIMSTLETGNRPLLKDKNRLFELYSKRHPHYLKTCDHVIDNNENVKKTIEKIKEVLA